MRLARALMQASPRLIILDEAFRGMDRIMRTDLLRRCRRLWPGAGLFALAPIAATGSAQVENHHSATKPVHVK